VGWRARPALRVGPPPPPPHSHFTSAQGVGVNEWE
jgi:hypothetical protein